MPPTAPRLSLTSVIGALARTAAGNTELSLRENELRRYFNVSHTFLVSSGRAALTMILQALSKLAPKRRRVVVPAFTCYSVPAAISRVGLTVTACDMNPETLDFNFEHLANIVDDSVLCVIAQHLFGLSSDMNSVDIVCRDAGAFLVEDAAQAMGARQEGKLIGSHCDVTFFSLGRGKNISCGAGGIITSCSNVISKELYRLHDNLPRAGSLMAIKQIATVIAMRTFLHPTLYWLPAGLSVLGLGSTKYEEAFAVTQLSDIQAAMLSDWEGRLEQSNHIRRVHARYIRRHLPKDLLPRFDSEAVYLRFPILADCEAASQRLTASKESKRLGLSKFYPQAICDIPELQGRIPQMPCEGAKDIARRLVTVPTHHLLKVADLEAIVALINKQFQSRHMPVLELEQSQHVPMLSTDMGQSLCNENTTEKR